MEQEAGAGRSGMSHVVVRRAQEEIRPMLARVATTYR